MVTTSLLAERDIHDLTSMREAIEIVERNFAEDAEGRIINPAKLRMDLGEDGDWPDRNAVVVSMPAYVDWVETAGLKIINGFWDNVDTDLPTMSGLILLVDMNRGTFQAVMEGAYLTGLRTGAQAAVGAKHLSTPDPETATIYGAGTQGRNAAYALDEAMDLDLIKVYDTREEALARYIADVEPEIETDLRTVTEPKAGADSDVIVTVTTATEPFIEREWLKDGAVIAALGTNQEVGDDVIRDADKIVVDHVEQSLHAGNLEPLVETGELTAEDVYGTIGEVVAGQKRGRDDDDEIVLYVPFGLAAHDIAIGKRVFEKATERSGGESFEFV